MLASSYYEAKSSWSINGTFDFVRQNLVERGRELQYSITPMPQKTNLKSITVSNIMMPSFSWKIDLKRILAPHVFETFIPMTIMVTVSWMSFLIPPQIVPGRGGLLVTLLLVLTTFHLRELDKCPAVRDITPLLVWSSVCLLMVALALFEYAFVLYFIRFGEKKDDATRKVKQYFRLDRRIQRRRK